MLPDELGEPRTLSKLCVLSTSAPLAPPIRNEVDQFFQNNGDISLFYPIDPYLHYGSEEFLFSANAASDRLKALKDFLESQELGVALVARGGVGAHELLSERLRSDVKEALGGKQKVLCGFSDFTVLLLALYGLEGLTLIHGPSLLGFRSEVPENLRCENLNGLLRLLKGDCELLSSEEISLISGAVEEPVVAPIIGGNLSVLCSMVGTPFLPDLRGALLLLEDVGEPPHSIYRHLCHLGASGLLDDVQGVLLGEFTRCSHRAGKGPELSEVFRQFFARWSFPVYSTEAFGHGEQNRALPLGRDVRCGADGVSLVKPLSLNFLFM